MTVLDTIPNNQHPLVSVVVPVFNVMPFLKRCIDSISQQTYTNIEIILIDDGSTDGSGKLCESLKQSDQRISVIHQKNAGLSAARNTGISHSKGEFIVFIDSDDFIDNGYINSMVAAVGQNTDIDLVITDFQTNKPGFSNPMHDKERIMSGTQAVIEAERLRNNLAYRVAWDKLYRRRLFDYVLFPVGKIHEDEYTYYRFLYDSRMVYWINSPGYHYCLNPNGITGQQGSAFSLDSLEAFTQKSLFYLQKPVLRYSAARSAIEELQWYFLLMVRKKWEPQNNQQKEQYQLIYRQIVTHKKEMMSVLPFARKVLLTSMLYSPQFTSELYFSFKHIAKRLKLVH